MNGYVEAGYSVVLASLAAYSLRVVLRRRSLERALLPPRPDEEGQRWP